MQSLTVIGLGYMGLPTALLMARGGAVQVCGYDISKEKVAGLNRGELPFEEPGLSELFKAGRERFRASTKLEPADVFLIALPTPVRPDHRCDLSYVDRAIDALCHVLRDDNLVILESTVSPGTTLKMRDTLHARTGKSLHVSYVSEKATPGDTLREMVENDRIIGAGDDAARARTERLYSTFVTGDLVFTDPTTAETAKLFENTFRDVNIALANEFADIAEGHGIDAFEVISLANRHPRVNILSPGPGVGGHCIPLDPWFLIEDSAHGDMIRLARRINEARPDRVLERLRGLVPKGCKVTILGTAYKKNVDDDRESPSHALAEKMTASGYQVSLHDPHVRGIESSLAASLRGAEGVVLMTDHDAYKGIDWSTEEHAHLKVVDTRGLWRDQGPKLGARYVLLGSTKNPRAQAR